MFLCIIPIFSDVENALQERWTGSKTINIFSNTDIMGLVG